MDRRIHGPWMSALLWGFITILGVESSLADDTWVYAVQIHADVQTAPPAITLNWQPDYHFVTNYLVYRKAKDAVSWGSPTNLPGSALSYVDTNVAVGGTYEYQIVKFAEGYRGYGYIFAGIAA